MGQLGLNEIKSVNVPTKYKFFENNLGGNIFQELFTLDTLKVKIFPKASLC